MAGWTDAEDRKLLLSIIQLLSPSPPNWEDVANKVGKTKEAVRQRYQKLKKETIVASEDDDGSSGPAGPRTKQTARKRNTKATKDEDDEEDVKPAKKVRAKKVKKEDVDAEDADAE
ncbi:hypothetical protein M8818_004985 [Zalaria obscura]|uniref:Uncharacterized protein n=1 Tax=Zalaria obscura TaxID=2024903 RepID=A0ACC3SBV9_9PEZI